MKIRRLPAAMLPLSCLVLAGCGDTSPPTSAAEAKAVPLSASDIADAQADIDHASEEERAYQSQNSSSLSATQGR